MDKLNRRCAVAESSRDPLTLAMVHAGNAFTDYQLGHWQAAIGHAARACEVLRERCTGVSFQIDSIEMYRLWALYYLGELREFSERVPQLLREAEQRGDIYISTSLTAGIPATFWLCRGAVDEGRRVAAESMRMWSRRAYHLQHFWETVALGQADFYEGRGTETWKRINEQWKPLSQSFLLRIQMIRIEALHLRARAALTAAKEFETARSSGPPLARCSAPGAREGTGRARAVGDGPGRRRVRPRRQPG